MSLEKPFARSDTAVVAAGCLAALFLFLCQAASAVVLSYESIDTPSFAVFNSHLFMAYTGTDSDHSLNFAVSSDGLTYSQVTWGGNRSATGIAIAPFNGKMYVVWVGASDHLINIASSTDGQHYSGQFIINSGWSTQWRPALSAGAGKLWLSWLAGGNILYVASSTDGVHFSIVAHLNPIPGGPGVGTSSVVYPPTLAAPNSTSTPQIVYTWSQGKLDNPNYLYVCQVLATSLSGCNGACRSSPTGGGIQGGLGFLPSETLLAWRTGQSPGTEYLDVNGGTCIAGGTTYGSFGSTGVAPAVVGFNGHAYYAWTGTDSSQHLNVIQVF